MSPVIIKTTRWKRGNFLFPATVEVTDEDVIYCKKYWFIKRKRSIKIKNIASIHVKNFHFSSEMLFKQFNGSPPFSVVGVRKSDSHRIREIVERLLGV